MNQEEVRVVLCEGYDDRAFWKQWLLTLGCREEEGLKQEHRGRGQFAYLAKDSDARVVVMPYGGLPHLGVGLETAIRKRPKVIVISRDADTVDDDNVAVDRSLEALAQSHGFEKVSNRTWTRDSMRLNAVVWEQPCIPFEGTVADVLPQKRTLERLICAAILGAYPDCVDPLRTWLSAAPEHLGKHKPVPHRQCVWSLFAKWLTWSAGTDDTFYERPWLEEKIRDQLEELLRQDEAWGVVTSIAR